MDKQPRNSEGQFVSPKCDVCGCGDLVPSGEPGVFECNGLIDPENENVELQPCTNYVSRWEAK